MVRVPPQLEFARRRYRLSTGYGGMSLPQGTGTPTPPDGGNLIFDWNPAVDPRADLVGGLSATVVGDVTFGTNRTLPCATFAGGHLLFNGAPFANLSDLPGGAATMYVVCEYTGAGSSGSAGPLSLDQASHPTANEKQFSLYSVLSSNATVAIVADDAAFPFDTGPVMTRNTLQVWSAEVGTSHVAAYLDGVSNGTTAISIDKSDMDLDRLIIGAVGSFGGADVVSGPWTGHIHRVLIYAGGFNSDVIEAA